MQLTLYTDYSLRVLVYLSLLPEGQSSTISEIADYYQISRNHLVKVVHNLSNLSYIITSRGKGGGLRLARPASEINIGDVVTKVEPHLELVECFNEDNHNCRIEELCALKHILLKSRKIFINELYKYTLDQAVFKNREVQVPFIKAADQLNTDGKN